MPTDPRQMRPKRNLRLSEEVNADRLIDRLYRIEQEIEDLAHRQEIGGYRAYAAELREIIRED